MNVSPLALREAFLIIACFLPVIKSPSVIALRYNESSEFIVLDNSPSIVDNASSTL